MCSEKPRMVKVELPEEKPAGVELLRAQYESYVNRDPQVQAGAMVQWKDGMRSGGTPAYGEPAVVVELLEEPVCVSAPSGYAEPADMVVGYLSEDGELALRYADSHRFTAYAGE